jgi:hypothetical protein
VFVRTICRPRLLARSILVPSSPPSEVEVCIGQYALPTFLGAVAARVGTAYRPGDCAGAKPDARRDFWVHAGELQPQPGAPNSEEDHA